MEQIKVKKLRENSKLPVLGSSGAGAMDVYASTMEVSSDVKGHTTVKYGIGLAFEIPEGYRMMIVPRSNLTRHNWAMVNSPGIVDSDYRGEVSVVLTALNTHGDVFPPYEIGDRVAQCYFEPITKVDFRLMQRLSNTERGDGGYGSTGLK